VGCDPGAVAFWFYSGHSALSLAGFIGPNFPINRRRRPNAEIRSRSERVRFVHSPPLRLQKRLRLRKSELDKKTILFFETCISRGSFQSRSGIGPQINTGPEDSSTEDKSVIFWDTDVSLQISLPSLFSIR
jgi:hypothetical protein